MAVKKRATNGERKPRDREQRWDEIIEAAAIVFYEKGYAGASLQDIASRVGLLKGSIYYYIDTKEDLLFELVMRAQTVWRATLVERDELGTAPAPTRLREFILRWMQLREREREWGVVAEREFRRLSEAYLAKVIEGRREFSRFVEGILRQGIEAGDFDRSISVPIATNMVFELMKSAHLHRRPGTRGALAEFADAYALLLNRGLGNAGWRPPTGG